MNRSTSAGRKRAAFLVISNDADLTADAEAVLASARLVVSVETREALTRHEHRPIAWCGIVVDDDLDHRIVEDVLAKKSGAPVLAVFSRDTPSALLTQVRRAGGSCIGKPIAARDMARFLAECLAQTHKLDPAPSARLSSLAQATKLTPAEIEVLALRAAEWRMKAIAAARGVSVNTVKTQLRVILKKLRVTTLREAIVLVRN